MRAFERWNELTGSTLGYFVQEAAAAWDSLLDFQETSGIGGALGEIGVLYGKSASLLALHAQAGERLALVDLHFPPEEQALIDPLVSGKLVTRVAGRSSRLRGSPETRDWPRAFRWFHINGEHTGEAVFNDLQLSNLWLADTGVICLDDLFFRIGDGW